jgi:hypothetical protein
MQIAAAKFPVETLRAGNSLGRVPATRIAIHLSLTDEFHLLLSHCSQS